MTAPPHVMVDLETLGTAPGCVVLSIGAATFDPHGRGYGAGFYRKITRQSAEAAGLTVDPATAAWWAEQSEAAYLEAFTGGEDIRAVLADFATWWREAGAETFWAHDPSFDKTILEAAFRAVGLEWPWSHRAARCTRTLAMLSGVEPDRSKGTHHRALDDALNQVAAVQEGLRVMAVGETQLRRQRDELHETANGYLERARKAEALATPDLFWDAEDPEYGGLSPWEIADNYSAGDVVRLQCARALPDRWTVRVPDPTGGDTDTCPLFDSVEAAEAAYTTARAAADAAE